MSRRTTNRDIRMLLDVRGKLITAMRGIDHPFKPRAYRYVDMSIDDPVACRHGVDWLTCATCSTRRAP